MFEQGEVVRAFVKGNDLFVSLPTAYSTLFRYAILPLVFDTLYRCFSC